jgi:hypothetical protein
MGAKHRLGCHLLAYVHYRTNQKVAFDVGRALWVRTGSDRSGGREALFVTELFNSTFEYIISPPPVRNRDNVGIADVSP